MRPRDCLFASVRDLRRQPLRSSLTLLALVISTSLLVTLVTLGLETRRAIVEQLTQDRSVNTIVVSSSGSSGGDPSSSVQLADQAVKMLDDSTALALSRVPGVAAATPTATVWQFKQFSVVGHDGTFVARATAIAPTASTLFTLAAGRGLDADSQSPQVVLGNAYAKALGVSDRPSALVGATVQITTQPGYRGQGAVVSGAGATQEQPAEPAGQVTELDATVVGVTAPGSADNQLFLPMGWAHGVSTISERTPTGVVHSEDALTAKGYSSIIVQTLDSTRVRPVTQAIQALGYGTSSKQTQIDQINQLSTVMWIVLGAISLISVVSAALGIVNTMLMTVSEQRYAIGVWRACGATRGLIANLFLTQAALLGLVAGMVGTSIGVWVSGHVNETIAGLLREQGLTAVTISRPSPTFLLSAVALITLLAVAAASYPAYRATRDIQV